jgi:hypothetical protein
MPYFIYYHLRPKSGGHKMSDTLSTRTCGYAKLANLLGVVDDVRTLGCRFARLAKRMSIELQSDEGKKILQNIKIIRRHFEPKVVAHEEAQQLRKARAAARLYRGRGDDASWQQPPAY